MNAKDKIKITHPDRALMLRLPEPLHRARNTPTPLDDGPEGVVLGSAWSLEAVCAGVSALATDPPPPIDTTGAGVLLPIAGGDDLLPVAGADDLPPAAGVGDLRPAAGVGDLHSAPMRDGFTNDPGVSLPSPSVTGTSSSPAPR